MSSDSDQPSPRRSKQKSPHNKNNFNSNNSFSIGNISSAILPPSSPRQIPTHTQDQTSLLQQNRKLRRKLKQLSLRLDEQLQRAAQNKLKLQSLSKHSHPIKNDNLQLQNAYKTIQRLQKSLKDFQNKQSYQISVKRIMDLESIIKKKEQEIDQLKQQVKINKKIHRDKEKHIDQLIQNSKKATNVTEDKELIDRMRKKIKKLTQDNDMLRKKELAKHQQLITAERKLVQIQQDEEIPIGREEALIKEMEEIKKKYKQAMQRVDKQNVYITRLNEKIDKEGQYSSQNRGRKSQSDKDRRNVSKSVQQLPSLGKVKVKPILQLLQHLPSPKAAIKLKRY